MGLSFCSGLCPRQAGRLVLYRSQHRACGHGLSSPELGITSPFLPRLRHFQAFHAHNFY
jgi:hypothetical protein